MLTTTAVAFIFTSLGLTICGQKFLKALKKTSDSNSSSKIGFLLTLFFIGFAIQTGVILGLGTLLLAKFSQGLYFVILAANSFLTILALLGVYTTYYVFFPRAAIWPAMTIVFILGMISIVLTITTHPQPFITSTRGIDWNVSFPLSLIMFYMLLVSIGSQLYIFTKLFIQTKTRELKITSFIIALTALIGVIAQFIRFIVLQYGNASLRTGIYDIVTGLVGLVFILGLVIIPLVCSKFRTHKKDN